MRFLGNLLARVAVVLFIAAALASGAQAADTTSTNLQLLLMGTGLHSSDWGTQTNANLTKVESAIAGISSITVTGDATLTADQARPAVLKFTGTLTANTTITVPAVSKMWVVVNNTTGSYTLTLTTGSGATVTIPQAAPWHMYFCDGTNVYDVSTDGLPTLTSNTVYANTGSGAAAVTLSAFTTALGLSSTDTPTFAALNLSAAAGTSRGFNVKTAGSQRWFAGGNATAEGGSNAGTDYNICATADDGTTSLGCYVTINRATGATTFTGAVAVPSLTVNGLQLATAPGFYSNIKITVSSDTALAASADGLVMVDASGNAKYFSGLSAASVSTACSAAPSCMDTGTAGTSRWLNVWAVGTSAGSQGVVMTANAAPTPPTMPTGYTFYRRLGAVRVDASGHLVRTKQVNQDVQYVATGTAYFPTIASSSVGNPSTPVFVATAVSSYVPPTASEIDLVAMNHGSQAIAAPNTNFGGYTSSTNPPPILAGVAGSYVVAKGSILLESSNVYLATGSTGSIFCDGWKDAL